MYRVIQIQQISLFQGNPQRGDQKVKFWNSFTKQSQQFLCTSNIQLKRPETKKIEKEQGNRHNNYHVLNMKEQLTTIKKQNKKIEKISYPPFVSPAKA